MKVLNSIFILILFFSICISQSCTPGQGAQKTICNPINLNYKFQMEEPSRREAADPSVVRFKDMYFLFASKSGGYWTSDDLIEWEFITTNDLPLEDYAPTAVVIADTLYWMANGTGIYASSEPEKGKWQLVKERFSFYTGDPCLFLDDDQRLYLYWGLSNFMPISGIELDKKNFEPIGPKVELIGGNSKKYGWERPEDYNNYSGRKKPWIEGAWMNKHDNRYYLQYAAPGTEYKSYSDGVYISDFPLGPFKVAKNNPFSYKPEGFVAGAGHGSTFLDKYGNYWHMATMTISVKHNFERRLGLFPAFFDEDGTLYTYTGFGDFPHVIPQKLIKEPEEFQPHWMLLSYNKSVEVSSTLNGHPKINATNENIRDYWSAQTGNKGEWITVDLEDKCKVGAVQLNFAEEGCSILGRPDSIFYQYLVEYSSDNTNWKTLIDKTSNTKDCPHDYVELATPVFARYIRLTNFHVPGGKFAVSGFRVFGKGNGKAPKQVSEFTVTRDSLDKRNVTLTWQKISNVTGYNIRYGVYPDKIIPKLSGF